MLLINCENESYFNLVWKFFYKDAPVANEATTFKLTDKNFYVPVVTLATQDNAKLL